MKIFLAAAAALALAGCDYTGVGISVGTPYYGNGYGGGYSDRCIAYDRYGRAYYVCGGYSSRVYYYPGYTYRRGYYYDRDNRRYHGRDLYHRHHGKRDGRGKRH